MSALVVGSLLEIGKNLISRVWPDPAKQAEELLKLKELEQKGDLAELDAYVKSLTGQLRINEMEAQHPSIFVAGWRPWAGWVGGFSLAYAAILEPLMRFIATMFGYSGEFPELDTSITVTVLLGMLGIGAQRSYDKKHLADTKRTCK